MPKDFLLMLSKELKVQECDATKLIVVLQLGYKLPFFNSFTANSAALAVNAM